MRIVDHFHHPQRCNVHWLLLTGGSVNPALHTEFIGCDLCLRGTDIVLWLYINPQRTDECFSLPSARGRSSGERLPPREPGGPSAQRHLPLWEVKLGPSLITLSAACWPTETSAENIMAQAQYLYLLFFRPHSSSGLPLHVASYPFQIDDSFTSTEPRRRCCSAAASRLHLRIQHTTEEC